MAEFPALPFFTDAYLADTIHLTTEEHGAYLLLLMTAWRTRGCCLPDDDKMLARITRTSPARWRRLRPTLQCFFEVVDGRWEQKRLLKTYGDVEKRVAKNRMNGAKGGRARAAKAAQAKHVSEAANPLKVLDTAKANAVPQPKQLSGNIVGDLIGENLPTKTRTKLKLESESRCDLGEKIYGDSVDISSSAPLWVEKVAAAAGLSFEDINHSVVMGWLDAGLDMEKDILPTLKRIRQRQEARLGRVPAHISYYSDAIVEARAVRLGEVGGQSSINHLNIRKLETIEPIHNDFATKRPFNHESLDDWRDFLGDGQSRFRGDYLSKHWFINEKHPIFRPCDLGPDPKHTRNTKIPDAIYHEYGERWLWLSWQRPHSDKHTNAVSKVGVQAKCPKKPCSTGLSQKPLPQKPLS